MNVYSEYLWNKKEKQKSFFCQLGFPVDIHFTFNALLLGNVEKRNKSEKMKAKKVRDVRSC